jgi:hypothetical protein
LIFLRWYSAAEPPHLTGLDADLSDADTLIAEAGGVEVMLAETQFAIGILADRFPECFGDESIWRSRSQTYLREAAAREPASRLFREWPLFVRESDDTAGPRIYIEREVRARFHGRGAYGVYMEDALLSMLGRPDSGANQ